jgi:hypothetical protein
MVWGNGCLWKINTDPSAGKIAVIINPLEQRTGLSTAIPRDSLRLRCNIGICRAGDKTVSKIKKAPQSLTIRAIAKLLRQAIVGERREWAKGKGRPWDDFSDKAFWRLR